MKGLLIDNWAVVIIAQCPVMDTVVVRNHYSTSMSVSAVPVVVDRAVSPSVSGCSGFIPRSFATLRMEDILRPAIPQLIRAEDAV